MNTSKSYGGYLLGLYGAMFSDIVRMYPDLRVDCERDYKRLLLAVEQHGLYFLFETLPSFSKHFERCLANEHLTPSGLTHLGPFKTGRMIPRLFKGLILRVFDEFGELRSTPDVHSIRIVRQLCKAAKRFRVECPNSATWKQVDEFFRVDDEIRRPSLCWDIGDFDSDLAGNLHCEDFLRSEPEEQPILDIFPYNEDQPTSVHSRFDLKEACHTIQGVADILVSILGNFDPLVWKARHGPGAVSDLRTGCYKYSFPHWPDKLQSVFPMDIFAYSDFLHAATDSHKNGGSQSYRLEPPARLIAVPKTYMGPRLIASEPTSHQWTQQIIRDFLMSRVKDTVMSNFISFDDQGKNGAMALEASIDGSHSTIDLSAASDRLSCFLIERLFRRSPSTLSAFYAVRTRWIVQDIDKKSPAFHKLRKFSTMGSALTFPVQSIVFLIVALGSVLWAESKKPSLKNIGELIGQVRVFGDDIIVPNAHSGAVVDMLTYLGFKVNSSKTFQTGKFRESCGIDAYGGTNVSSVSILSMPSVSKPESVLSAIDTHNNLFSKGWYSTASHLRAFVGSLGRFKFPTVEPGSGTIGWFDFMWFDKSSFKKRFNRALHRVELRVTQPRGSATRAPVDSNAMILQYYTEVTKPPISKELRLGVQSLRHPLRLGWVWASS
jgi:hypothetical protein